MSSLRGDCLGRSRRGLMLRGCAGLERSSGWDCVLDGVGGCCREGGLLRHGSVVRRCEMCSGEMELCRVMRAWRCLCSVWGDYESRTIVQRGHLVPQDTR
jgi:hypothetical protein